MRRIPTALLLLLTVVAFGSGRPADGPPPAPVGMPWAAIGKLTFSGGGYCTGALVAPRVVVTAGHCLAGPWMGDGPQAFYAGPADNGWTARSDIAAVEIAAGFDYDRFAAGSDLDGLDYGFVLLTAPIGTEIGYFTVRPLSGREMSVARTGEGSPVIQAGYGGDGSGVLSIRTGCAVARGPVPGTLSHGCDTRPGDSGSPLFLDREGRFELIGIDSASYSGPDPRHVAVDSGAFVDALARFVQGGEPDEG
ncbi:MAG: trypsin-like serine peptidase [Inquilinaceae bacterium]